MWFHNMSNGMDQDSMNKWKEEFQNERDEQFSKVKQLQKDTQKRRKIMEMRRQMEAAKEEKRRQEALAERRALHVEATMRFQKGIKNFRANKEKISLDDALKSLNKRVNSGDNTITSTTSDAYSLILNNSNNSNKNRPHSSMNRNNIRRSSSFNDLLAHTNNTIENKLQQYQQQIYNQQHQIYYQQQQQQQQQRQQHQQHQQQNETSYFKNYNHTFSKGMEDIYNKTSTSDNTTTTNNNNNINTTVLISQNQNQDQIKSNNNVPNNFKSVLDENQKTIQNFNKEALNEFKNTIMSEINSANVREDYNNKSCPIQPIIINNHQNINNSNTVQNNNQQALKVEQNVYPNNNNNMKINTKKDLVTSSTDEIISNDEIGLNEDLSSISSHNISDMEDSLEFDVLKGNTNLRSKSATVTKSVGINVMVPNNNDIKPIVNNNLEYNQNNSNQNNDKNSFMNQVSNIKNHFLTKNTANDLFSNNLLSSKKTYFAPQFQNENTEDKNDNKETSNERVIQRANTFGKIQTRPIIKSILKRSTSDNTLNLMAQNSNHVNFGLKMEKIEVKDSLEVATNRAKSNSNIAKELNTITKKKSVRFASKDETNEDNNSQVDQNEENNDIEIIQNPSMIAKGAQIRRPVVKSRINLNNNKKTLPITPISITNDDSQNDSKTIDSRPPLPPYVHENSYLVMSQKRKEFVEKNRGKTNEIITSPQVTLNEQAKPNVNNTEQNQIKHQYNDEIENKVQSQVTTKNNFVENVSQGEKLETKKPDNFSTYNNKYGNTEPQTQQQAKHLLARLNNTVSQQNNLHDASANVIDPTVNYQVTIMNNNKKYPPNKNIIKAFTNNTSVVEIQQLPFNNHFPTTNLRRPLSANTPLTSNDNHLMVNPTNPSNIVYQNQIVQQVPRISTKLITFNGTSTTSPQRIFSADSANQNMRYKKYVNNPMIQLRIQYPDNIKYAQNQAEEDENVTISMNEFLKAEEMCNTQLTESKVINFLDHMHNRQPNNTPTKLLPVTLSMEEQNVKNSIQRLNDKLNLLNRKTQTGLRRNYN